MVSSEMSETGSREAAVSVEADQITEQPSMKESHRHV
jgi:hypothetical protein